MNIFTQESLVAAGKLYGAMDCSNPDKAVLASMIAEAFLNGMKAQELLASSSGSQQQART